MAADLTPNLALQRAAQKARDLAYAPYSLFRVGAAIRCQDGRIVTGGNVENASYGLTLCAERAALVAALAQGVRPGDIVAMVVAADAAETTSPCGACRQVLRELCAPGMPVTCYNVRDQKAVAYTVEALLPDAFGPHALASASHSAKPAGPQG